MSVPLKQPTWASVEALCTEVEGLALSRMGIVSLLDPLPTLEASTTTCRKCARKAVPCNRTQGPSSALIGGGTRINATKLA